MPPSSGNGPPGGRGGKEVDAVNISISNQNGKPIYEQITEQIKALILAGQLKEGDPLPSMRLLAKELRISVITTKRAYEELEKEGYLYTVAGKGCFVSPRNEELVREERLKEMESHLARAAELAQMCGLTKEEYKEALELFWEEGQ